MIASKVKEFASSSQTVEEFLSLYSSQHSLSVLQKEINALKTDLNSQKNEKLRAIWFDLVCPFLEDAPSIGREIDILVQTISRELKDVAHVASKTIALHPDAHFTKKVNRSDSSSPDINSTLSELKALQAANQPVQLPLLQEALLCIEISKMDAFSQCSTESEAEANVSQLLRSYSFHLDKYFVKCCLEKEQNSYHTCLALYFNAGLVSHAQHTFRQEILLPYVSNLSNRVDISCRNVLLRVSKELHDTFSSLINASHKVSNTFFLAGLCLWPILSEHIMDHYTEVFAFDDAPSFIERGQQSTTFIKCISSLCQSSTERDEMLSSPQKIRWDQKWEMNSYCEALARILEVNTVRISKVNSSEDLVEIFRSAFDLFRPSFFILELAGRLTHLTFLALQRMTKAIHELTFLQLDSSSATFEYFYSFLTFLHSFPNWFPEIVCDTLDKSLVLEVQTIVLSEYLLPVCNDFRHQLFNQIKAECSKELPTISSFTEQHTAEQTFELHASLIYVEKLWNPILRFCERIEKSSVPFQTEAKQLAWVEHISSQLAEIYHDKVSEVWVTCCNAERRFDAYCARYQIVSSPTSPLLNGNTARVRFQLRRDIECFLAIFTRVTNMSVENASYRILRSLLDELFLPNEIS